MPSRRTKRPGPGRPKDDELAARRRSQIIEQAIKEFARRGYAEADLDVIAQRAKCSKGTLYHYFSTKRNLFGEAVNDVMTTMSAAAGAGDGGDPLDQLENLVRGFLRHFAEHPEHVELLVQERSDFRDREESTYEKYREASRQRWRDRFAKLMAAGRMRQMPVEQAINIMADLLYGTIFMNHFRHRKISPEHQAEQLLEVLLGGLLTDKEFNSRHK